MAYSGPTAAEQALPSNNTGVFILLELWGPEVLGMSHWAKTEVFLLGSSAKFLINFPYPNLYSLSFPESVPLKTVVVQLLSCVQLFATPWTAARQLPSCFTLSLWSLLKLMSIEENQRKEGTETTYKTPCPCPLKSRAFAVVSRASPSL